MQKITITLFLLLALSTGNFIAPNQSSAQGNNMGIYNKILKDHNHPSQNKQWRREQAEAPMLDVDAIVRREQEARRRQQAQQPRPQPRRQARCREGQKLSDTGCGIYGIHPCFCVNGQPAWK